MSSTTSPRIGDTTSKNALSPTLGNGSGSHTNLASRRQLVSTPTKSTPRSRSLSASNKNGSSTCLASATPKYGGASRIPVQSKEKNPVAKRSPSVGDRAKAKSFSRVSSPVPGVKSSATTVASKPAAALRLPRASTPNASSATGAPGTPRTRSPSRTPGRSNQTGAIKRPTSSPLKGKPVSGIKRETSKLSTDTANVANTTKASSQKNVSGDEEIIKEINLNNIQKRKLYTEVSRPKEVKIDMQMINDSLNVIAEECFSLCSELSEHKNSILTNLIDISGDQSDDTVLSEKIANYLKGGDGMYQRYKLLKQTQHDISSTLNAMVSDLNSETIALRSISNDLENKLELLEAENESILKQMKALSEELESERESMASLNQKKTQLEQQIKKHAQRIKELETKSSSSDGKIYQQSSQLKSYEAQLKLKDDKYQALEQKLNHQAQQCRMAMEVREKLEKQRESLEARVSDLKKLKAEQQVDSAKVEEKLREEIREANRLMENEKQQREILEQELKSTQERLVSVQEKSLELSDVIQVSKATIAHEGSLKTSEKEAKLQMSLNEVQQQLEMANKNLDNYKQENEELRTAVFQATESINKNGSSSEVAAVISILKSEIVGKDETIRSLKQQMEAYVKEADERGRNLKEMEKKWNEDKDGGDMQEQEQLWQEILDLRHRLIQSEKENQKNLQLLTQKQLEVEQRERVMREQAKVLQVRDELLKLLRKKDKAKTGQMTALQAKLEDQERNVDTVNKFFYAKAEQLQEIYSTLEMKQRRVMQLEEEVKLLQAQNERGLCQRTKMEARIAELELAVHEKGRTSCTSSVYNPRCKSSTYSPSITNHSHSYDREPQEVFELPTYHTVNHQIQVPRHRLRYSNRLPHTTRKPYVRQNDKSRSVLQLYRIDSSNWGDSTYAGSMVATPHFYPSMSHFNKINAEFVF